MHVVNSSFVGSFFRYPGGKTKMLTQILPRLTSQYFGGVEYREPFLGGGAVLLGLLSRKPDIKKLWINDCDPGIACLWTSVIRWRDDLIARVENFEPSVDQYLSFKSELLACATMPTGLDRIIDIGFKTLALHQMSFSGLGTMAGGPLGGWSQASAYKINSRWSPVKLCQKIRAVHELLARVEIREGFCTCLDFEVLLKDDGCKTFGYLDPPYWQKGSELYRFAFSEHDHIRLARLLNETKQQWLLTYDDCPAIRDLYEGFEFERVDVGYSIAHVGATGKKRAPRKCELLISSGLALVQPDQLEVPWMLEIMPSGKQTERPGLAGE